MKKIVYILGGIWLLMAACEKDTKPSSFAPELTTGEAYEKRGVDAVLTGTIKSDPESAINEEEIGFMWAATEEKIILNNAEQNVAVLADGTYSTEVSGLTPGKYYFCIYAKSGYTTVKGKIKPFSVAEEFVPTIENLSVTQVNDDNITPYADITFDGNLLIEKKGFCWSTSKSSPTVNDDHMEIQSDDMTITGTISGLSYNTKYYIRAYAVNAKGINYTTGFVETTTKSSEKATLNTIKATDTTPSTITVSAVMSSDGGAEVTERGFCYSSESMPDIHTGIKISIKTSGNNLSAILPDLSAYTMYYIRAYAINKNGEAYSNQISATTKKADPTIDDPISPDNK